MEKRKALISKLKEIPSDQESILEHLRQQLKDTGRTVFVKTDSPELMSPVVDLN